MISDNDSYYLDDVRPENYREPLLIVIQLSNDDEAIFAYNHLKRTYKDFYYIQSLTGEYNVARCQLLQQGEIVVVMLPDGKLISNRELNNLVTCHLGGSQRKPSQHSIYDGYISSIFILSDILDPDLPSYFGVDIFGDVHDMQIEIDEHIYMYGTATDD